MLLESRPGHGWQEGQARQCRYAQASHFGRSRLSPPFIFGTESEKTSLNCPSHVPLALRVISMLQKRRTSVEQRRPPGWDSNTPAGPGPARLAAVAAFYPHQPARPTAQQPQQQQQDQEQEHQQTRQYLILSKYVQIIWVLNYSKHFQKKF